MDYNTGKVVDFDALLIDKKAAAKEISEGSDSLERLLLVCFDNNIRTISCCAHDFYISFEVNEDNLDFHMKLKKVLMDNYGIEILSELGESLNKISYVVYGKDESIFEKLNSGISVVLKNMQDSILYFDIECAFALINKIKGIHIAMPRDDNELFEIQSKKDDKKTELEEFFFSDNYFGNNLYILSRTDIQNALYNCYHNDELVNNKRGFLSKLLTVISKNKSK